MCSDILLHTETIQLTLEVLGGILLTVLCQLVIQLHATVGGGVGLYLDIDVLIRDLVSVLDEVLPVADLALRELGAAEISLLDEELDISVVLLLDDPLEVVRSECRHGVRHISECLGGDGALTYLQVGEADLLSIHLGIKSQEE